MHLLHECEDLVSIQRKLVSDVIDGIQTSLAQENPLFGKLIKKFDDSASTLKTLICFKSTNLLLDSTCLGSNPL